MEIINEKPTRPEKSRYTKRNVPFMALLAIIIGAVLLGRNLGYVDQYWLRIIISWQMLLIVLGVRALLKAKYTNAIVLMAVGLFFLAPRLGYMDYGWISTYWPLLLIAAGLFGVFKLASPKRQALNKAFRKTAESQTDGFIRSENAFGNAQHIVLDPVFQGADIQNTFGGTLIDLRRTALPLGDTVIELECTFGGVEIYVPNDWTVVFELESAFSGVRDKRYGAQNIPDSSRRLIIRGKATFSGLEIKN